MPLASGRRFFTEFPAGSPGLEPREECGKFCEKGHVEALLALPVAGLMTTETAKVFIEKQAAFYAKLRSLFDFAEGIDPVMTMAFTALPVIPAVRLTDMGLFDVTRFAFTTVEV